MLCIWQQVQVSIAFELTLQYIYTVMPRISPRGLICFKEIYMGLIRGGAYSRGGLNNFKQLFSLVSQHLWTFLKLFSPKICYLMHVCQLRRLSNGLKTAIFNPYILYKCIFHDFLWFWIRPRNIFLGWGLIRGGGLFASRKFYMGAYSRGGGGLIRGWGLNRGNTVYVFSKERWMHNVHTEITWSSYSFWS